ncbi:ArnT family glycosyltransferase [Sungkyunkwania multivorans]|uniref:ArnT family glycosyltransferase n=1 Tax=Sungkyunkwania multivorans TaxID=1173618 RepID=A0ABW3CTG9_9FLAO
MKWLSKFKENPKKTLLIFLGAMLIINLLQGLFTDLIFDEAYYWYFAQNLDWGYFDHPPMMALFIKISGLIFGGELGVRFFAPFLFAGSIYLTWLLIDSPKRDENILLFCAIAVALPLFNVYGFFMLPDTPLIFFGALFLYAYKRFLSSNAWVWVLLLGFSMAALMYSKYHAILLILGILISHPKLLLKFRFWVAILFSLLLFLPHLMWLYETEFYTLEYHIIERAKTNFKAGRVFEYIGGQLGARGFIFFFVFLALFKFKSRDRFQKGCKYVVFTALIFFLFSSFKRNTQPQWTIEVIVPLMVISFYYLIENVRFQKWFFRLALVNLAVILFARIALVKEGLLPINYEAHGNKTWVADLYEQSGGLPVVFENSYRDASMYAFYAGVDTYSANNIFYRKSQYDLDSTEMKMQGKKVVYVHKGSRPYDMKTFSAYKQRTLKGKIIDEFHSYRKLRCVIPLEVLSPNTADRIPLEIFNPYNEAIDLREEIIFHGFYLFENNKIAAGFTFIPEEMKNGESIIIGPNETLRLHFSLKTPSELKRIEMANELKKKEEDRRPASEIDEKYEKIKFFRVALSEYGIPPGFQGRRIAIDEQ